ncbi:tubulin-tyrosine ligase-like protein [Strigomonas culicis]|uniref:Tubulin-tyrosine ligase-like protein n=1 Tax=Strigomonas culicis TaxID=28005 RepID=S9U9N0_9TRYP|nr:tubulin-tyrosine ligase-like protein [Strigomonas culicis]|eukprot:EPY25608.1 tubulin-tyrosine ligase-like protein [Strigomonas culicis]
MRDVVGNGGRCVASPSYRPTNAKAAEPLLFAEHLGNAHPLFTITSSSSEYYALRLPLLKAGFKRIQLSQNKNVRANLIWGRSMPFQTVSVDKPDGSGTTLAVRMLKGSTPEAMEHYSALSMQCAQQKFNHYPYSHRNVGCKRGLGRNLRNMQQFLTDAVSRGEEGARSARAVEEKYRFVPKTWLYPAERETLMDVFKKASPSQHFIWKPARGSCGRGIWITKGGITNAASWEQVVREINRQTLVQPVSKLLTDYVVQEYLEDPYLLNGRKMDLRLYVCVTSYDPLVAYLHEEGLVRLAADVYAPQADAGESDNLNTVAARFKHLTNYSVGRRYKQAGGASHMHGIIDENSRPSFEDAQLTADDTSERDAPPNIAAAPTVPEFELKWSLQRLWDYVDANSGPVVPAGYASASAKLKEDIALLITRTLMAVKPAIANAVAHAETPGSFIELYGFDVMLDTDRRPYLVEVNTLPSLESSSAFDYTTKTNVVADMLNVARLEPFERDPQQLAPFFNDANIIQRVDPCMMPFVHTLAEQQGHQGQPAPSLPHKEEVACRLRDELEYARGFKRLFPPLPAAAALQTDSPINGACRAMQSDILLFTKTRLLSEKDLSALEAES